MSQVDLGKFACGACRREYPWKPEYAGRKVKCKCGSVITAPTEPPRPAASDGGEDDDLLGGLYDLAAEEQRAAKAGATTDNVLHCPSCHQDIMPGEAVCPHCSFNLRTGTRAAAPRPAAAAATGGAGGAGGGGGAGNPMLAYAGMSRRSQVDARADAANAVGGSAMRELYVPGGLVILGLLGQLFINGHSLPTLGLSLVLNLVLSFVGVAMVAKMLELGFGAPGPAVLKMVAICLVPAAVAQAIGNVVGSDSAFVRHMVPAILIIPIAEVMFVLLFDLAYDEAIYTAVIIYLVSDWAVLFLVGVLMSGAAGGGFGGVSASREVERADEAAAESVERPNATESRAWLAETGHMFMGETVPSSDQLVTSLYNAGAKRVTTLSSSGQGYALIVEFPKKKADRDKVIAAIRQFEQKQKVPAEDQTQDEGQRYHTFTFGAGPL